MPGFNVLDANLPLYRNHFLEASAGTGKTFAIENIVTRLLMDKNGPEIGQILVVTFTRAATVELKARIRSRIQETMEKPPSYLFDQGEEALLLAKRRLQAAISDFDEAKIFTIHSFCFHALKESAFDAGIAFDHTEESASTERLKQIVKDHLRTALSFDLLSPRQLEKILKDGFDGLVARLVRFASQRIPIQPGPSFQQSCETLNKEIDRLRERFSIKSDKLLEDLTLIAPLYGKLTDKQKRVKEDILKGFEEFVALFKGDFIDFIDSPLLKMVPENALKKRSLAGSLNYPGFLEEMQKALLPIIQMASNPTSLFATLAERVRQHVVKVVQKEELFFFEDLLRTMEEKIADEVFTQKIRSEYRAVLIDEFQDTDPVQWKIFSHLFHTPAFLGPLYLVGDPKQAIYRFRRADIYTYLKAKEAIGRECWASLNCNFRAQPELVGALNQLFAAAADCITLPKLNTTLSIPPVSAAQTQHNSEWSDGKKSIHFSSADKEEQVYGLIADEIFQMHRKEIIPLREFAVLVKDRFQADRVVGYFKSRSLPAVTKRARSLQTSKAFPLITLLIKTACSPRDSNSLISLLGSPLFAYLPEEILESQETWREQFYDLRRILAKEGILSFFHAIIEIQGETLLKQNEGEEIYHDLLQLAEMIASHVRGEDTEQMLAFMNQLHQEDPDSEILQARQTSDGDAVQILTIHVSKGLEFDVVFPVGLMLDPSKKEELVLSSSGEEYCFDEASCKLASEEASSERMRQLYVACTRARRRLYLPILEEKNSPLKTFLDQVLKGESLESFVEHAEGMSFSLCRGEISKTCFHTGVQLMLDPPKKIELEFKPQYIQSFSSLAQKLKKSSPRVPNPDSIPSGAETGTLLHTLFEKIPLEEAFRANSVDALRPIVAPLIQETFLQKWESDVTQMVFNAFHTPLTSKGDTFCLADVHPDKIWKEVEFLFPSKEHSGYLKGFIDLFFEHQGKYYFLDWKSNDLGATPEDYAPKRLVEVMEEQAYILQAKIYRQALEKYLALFGNDAHHQLSGYFYVFLRGLGEKGNGVYYG